MVCGQGIDVFLYLVDHQYESRRAVYAPLPDGGWRHLLADRLSEYLWEFNTPKFSQKKRKDLNGLFQQVIGISVSKAIKDLLEDDELCCRLDAVVTLRGKIAHTGDALEDPLSPDILREHTDSFVEAAAAVEVIVHQEFRNKLAFAPWQITEPLKQVLRPVARNKLQDGWL